MSNPEQDDFSAAFLGDDFASGMPSLLNALDARLTGGNDAAAAPAGWGGIPSWGASAEPVGVPPVAAQWGTDDSAFAPATAGMDASAFAAPAAAPLDDGWGAAPAFQAAPSAGDSSAMAAMLEGDKSDLMAALASSLGSLSLGGVSAAGTGADSHKQLTAADIATQAAAATAAALATAAAATPAAATNRRLPPPRWFIPLPARGYALMTKTDMSVVLRTAVAFLERCDPLANDYYRQVMLARKGKAAHGRVVAPLKDKKKAEADADAAAGGGAADGGDAAADAAAEDGAGDAAGESNLQDRVVLSAHEAAAQLMTVIQRKQQQESEKKDDAESGRVRALGAGGRVSLRSSRRMLTLDCVSTSTSTASSDPTLPAARLGLFQGLSHACLIEAGFAGLIAVEDCDSLLASLSAPDAAASDAERAAVVAKRGAEVSRLMDALDLLYPPHALGELCGQVKTAHDLAALAGVAPPAVALEPLLGMYHALQLREAAGGDDVVYVDDPFVCALLDTEETTDIGRFFQNSLVYQLAASPKGQLLLVRALVLAGAPTSYRLLAVVLAQLPLFVSAVSEHAARFATVLASVLASAPVSVFFRSCAQVSACLMHAFTSSLDDVQRILRSRIGAAVLTALVTRGYALKQEKVQAERVSADFAARLHYAQTQRARVKQDSHALIEKAEQVLAHQAAPEAAPEEIFTAPLDPTAPNAPPQPLPPLPARAAVLDAMARELTARSIAATDAFKRMSAGIEGLERAANEASVSALALASVCAQWETGCLQKIMTVFAAAAAATEQQTAVADTADGAAPAGGGFQAWLEALFAGLAREQDSRVWARVWAGDSVQRYTPPPKAAKKDDAPAAADGAAAAGEDEAAASPAAEDAAAPAASAAEEPAAAAPAAPTASKANNALSRCLVPVAALSKAVPVPSKVSTPAPAGTVAPRHIVALHAIQGVSAIRRTPPSAQPGLASVEHIWELFAALFLHLTATPELKAAHAWLFAPLRNLVSLELNVFAERAFSRIGNMATTPIAGDTPVAVAVNALELPLSVKLLVTTCLDEDAAPAAAAAPAPAAEDGEEAAAPAPAAPKKQVLVDVIGGLAHGVARMWVKMGRQQHQHQHQHQPPVKRAGPGIAMMNNNAAFPALGSARTPVAGGPVGGNMAAPPRQQQHPSMVRVPATSNAARAYSTIAKGPEQQQQQQQQQGPQGGPKRIMRPPHQQQQQQHPMHPMQMGPGGPPFFGPPGMMPPPPPPGMMVGGPGMGPGGMPPGMPPGMMMGPGGMLPPPPHHPGAFFNGPPGMPPGMMMMPPPPHMDGGAFMPPPQQGWGAPPQQQQFVDQPPQQQAPMTAAQAAAMPAAPGAGNAAKGNNTNGNGNGNNNRGPRRRN